MKALLMAFVVSIVFAVFFAAFLFMPALVILLAYFGMTWHHKRLSRRAKAARASAKPDAPDTTPAPVAEGAPA
jgi:chromate transport protein ChrA